MLLKFIEESSLLVFWWYLGKSVCSKMLCSIVFLSFLRNVHKLNNILSSSLGSQKVNSFRGTVYPGKFNDILSPFLCLRGPLILPFSPMEGFFLSGWRNTLYLLNILESITSVFTVTTAYVFLLKLQVAVTQL
jgi:hypothetical protein